MSNDISNTDDIIDSRDVIARIEELQGERDSLAEDLAEATAERSDEMPETLQAVDDARLACDIWADEYGAELAALEALAEEASGYAADWQHGEALIRDSYFEEYAQQLAEDCGMIPANLSWPCNCIDWERAARELQMDYTAVDFDGVTYWIR